MAIPMLMAETIDMVETWLRVRGSDTTTKRIVSHGPTDIIQ